MKSLLQWLTYGGLMVVCLGCLLPIIFGPHNVAFKIVFCIGAVATFLGRLLTKYNGKDFRVRRLLRIQTWSALFFCVAGFFMWYSKNPQDWLVFTLAGAMIQCYVSLVLPKALKKAGEQ